MHVSVLHYSLERDYYLGCSRISEALPSSYQKDVHNCREYCGNNSVINADPSTPIIALKGTECYCLTVEKARVVFATSILYPDSQCNSLCEGQNEFCGSTDNLYSIYKINGVQF